MMPTTIFFLHYSNVRPPNPKKYWSYQ